MLTLYETNPDGELIWPGENLAITLHSSALEVFTDFEKVKPLVIDVDTSAVETRSLMRQTHVRLEFVIDKSQHLLGVVSLDDLRNQEIIKRTSKDFKRNELTLSDFYQHRNTLKAFDYSELSRSTVKEVIDVLKGNAQQHCLVTDGDPRQIRGIISASDIARKLSINIDITIDSSFASIFKAIHS